MQIALAQKRGGSQSDMARACGVKQPSVSAWLSGRTKTLKASTLLKAAKYLGVLPRWLAEGLGPMRDVEPISTAVLAKDPGAIESPGWPFRSITSVEWLSLAPELRAMVEGYARGLMSSTPPLRAANH